MKETAIVIGASSGLGKALCELLGKAGFNLILSSRNASILSSIANQLETKYSIKTKVLPVDLSCIAKEDAAKFVDACVEWSSYIRQVYFTAAVISDDDLGINSMKVLRETFETNFFGTTLLFTELAERFKKEEVNITVISSVSAIRPRGVNTAYASSKRALEGFILGLKHYYSAANLNIQLYRIGYMDTDMSRGKKLLLTPIAPLRVADYIIRKRKRKFGIRYYPFIWKWVAVLLPLFPWFLYRKIKF